MTRPATLSASGSRSSRWAPRAGALDLSDAFGNLGPFSQDASQVLGTSQPPERRALADRQFDRPRLRGADRARAASSARWGVNDQTFGALASRDKSLAEAIKIFPTFNEEARRNTGAAPELLQKRPAAGPGPEAGGAAQPDADPRTCVLFAPHLNTLFHNLDPLLTAAETGVPALRGTIRRPQPGDDRARSVPRQPRPDHPTRACTRATSQTSSPIPRRASPAPSTRSRASGANTCAAPDRLHLARGPLDYPSRLAVNRGNGYIPPRGIGARGSVAQNELFASHDSTTRAPPAA